MTEKQMHEAAWMHRPFTFKNNRGVIQTQRGIIRFGIPEPHGKKESEDAPKGSDRIGWTPMLITEEMVGQVVAVFTGIELKTENDRLKPGQAIWHNQLLEAGAISEIWQAQSDGTIKIIREPIDLTP